MNDQLGNYLHPFSSLTPKSGTVTHNAVMETQNSFKSLNPITEERLFHQNAKSELKRDSSLRTYNISTVDQEPF